MKQDLFETGFSKPPVDPLPAETINSLVNFAEGAFGCSEWRGLHGAKLPYYFNLDKAYSRTDSKVTSDFHDVLASRIMSVWSENKRSSDTQGPILAYVCPGGAPAGSVQARGALTERLGWQSVLVFPDKRLLRSRVIVGESADGNPNPVKCHGYPDSVKWIFGRKSVLLTDAATTGESIARAAGAMRTFICEPVAAVAIYDREEGADESLRTINLPLYALLTRTDVKDRDSLKKETREAIQASSQKIVRDLSLAAAG
jgi:hypothetical protein